MKEELQKLYSKFKDNFERLKDKTVAFELSKEPGNNYFKVKLVYAPENAAEQFKEYKRIIYDAYIFDLKDDIYFKFVDHIKEDYAKENLLFISEEFSRKLNLFLKDHFEFVHSINKEPFIY